MNELIEGLWNRELEYNLTPMDFTEFKQAIQTACKAQRNACFRRFKEHYPQTTSKSKGTVEIIIKNAGIERQDYE